MTVLCSMHITALTVPVIPVPVPAVPVAISFPIPVTIPVVPAQWEQTASVMADLKCETGPETGAKLVP